MERMARYMTRAPVALGKVFQQRDGRVKLLVPPDPRTRQDYVLFDLLEWVLSINCNERHPTGSSWPGRWPGQVTNIPTEPRPVSRPG